MEESNDEGRQSSLQFGGWISRKSVRKPRRSILEIIDPENFVSLLDEANSDLKPQSRTTSSANLNCDKGPITRTQIVETIGEKCEKITNGNLGRKLFHLTAPVSPRPLHRLVRQNRQKTRLIIGQLSPKREEQVSYLSRSKSPDSPTSVNSTLRKSQQIVELNDDSTNTSSSMASLANSELKQDIDIKCHKVKWSAFKKLHKKLDIESPKRIQLKSHSPRPTRLYPHAMPSALKSPLLPTRAFKVFKRKTGIRQNQNLSLNCARRVAYEESLSPEPSDFNQSLVAKRLTKHEMIGMNAMNSVDLRGRLFAERWATKRNDHTMIEFLKRIEQKRPLKKL